MYDGYVQTIRVQIQQEIMKIWSLRLSAILLPPIFYFSHFAMNIKATWTIVSLLASEQYLYSFEETYESVKPLLYNIKN